MPVNLHETWTKPEFALSLLFNFRVLLALPGQSGHYWIKNIRNSLDTVAAYLAFGSLGEECQQYAVQGT